MDLRQFRYFLQVAEEASFTRAAATLHISQPALSQQIKELEAELGVRLFDRSAQTVRLTQGGDIAIEYCRQALASAEGLKTAISAFKGLARGRVRIGVTQTFNAFYMPSILARFVEAYPSIDIEVCELANADIVSALRLGELSLAIGLGPVAPPLAQVPLYRANLAFVCASHHPLAAYPSLDLKRLAGEGVALLSKGFATRSRIDALFEAHGVRPSRILEFNTFSAILNAVDSGICVSITPADAGQVLPALDLHFGRIIPQPPERTVALLQGPAGLETPASLALAKTIRDFFEKRD